MPVTVKELIAILETLPPETEVHTAFVETDGYGVRTGFEPLVLNTEFGREGLTAMERAESENFEFLGATHAKDVPWIRIGREG